MIRPELNNSTPEYQRRVKELWGTAASGGTGGLWTPAAGAIIYSTATQMSASAVGTAGQALISGGAGAPTWFAGTQNGVIYASGASGILASTAQGAANTVLTANAGAPSFSTTPTVQAITLSGTDALPPTLSILNATVSARYTADSTSAYFGTLSNHPVQFQTNSTLRMTMASGGNIGIGALASSPDYTLELLDATAPKLALGDTGLAHGVTTFAQTDTFFLVEQVTNDAGGARLWGFSSTAGQNPLRLLGIFGNTSPTATVPAVWLLGGKRSGTSIADVAATETAFQVSGAAGTNYITTLGNGNTTFTGTITTTALTDSGLTAGRVVIAGTGGLLADDSDLTFSGSTLTATNAIVTTGLTNSALTAGRVVIAGTAGLLADDADLTFSGSRLTTTDLTVSGAGPHVIGGATNSAVGFLVTNAITGPGSAIVHGTRYTHNVTGGIGDNIYGVSLGITSTRAGSGTHGLVANFHIGQDAGGGGGAAVTNSASLYIADAPFFGTNPYAIFVDAGNVRFDADLLMSTGGGMIEMLERTAPTAGAANTGRLYLVDNGSGKTQLAIIFATGAAQIIATQP